GPVRIDFFLVAERNRLECGYSFARFVHWLNCVFETSRGSSNAQFTGRAYYYLTATHGSPEDFGNKARLLGALFADANGVSLPRVAQHIGADVDVIIAGSEIGPGIAPKRNIV